MNSFTMPWVLNYWDDVRTALPTANVTWNAGTSFGGLRHDLTFAYGTNTQSLERLHEEVIYRVICHALLDALPAAALAEAAESIADIYRHYQAKTRPKELAKRASTNFTGRLGTKVERPQVRFSEEP